MKRIKSHIIGSLLLLVALLSVAPLYAYDIPELFITCAEYKQYTDSNTNAGSIVATVDGACWKIKAVPNEGWKFLYWDDDHTNTDTVRYLDFDLAEEGLEKSFRAIFRRYLCLPVEGESIDTTKSDYGRIDTTRRGDVLYVEAVPKDGYTFAQWADGSFQNPRPFVPGAGAKTALYATFIPDSTVGKIDSWSEDKFIITTAHDGEALWQDFRKVNVYLNGNSVYCETPDREDIGVYIIDIADLSDYAGDTLHFVYKDINRSTGYFEPFATLDVVIPVIATNGSAISSVPSEATGIHVIDGVATISGTGMHIAALDIYPGAKAVVTGTVVADSIVMRRSDTISAYPPELVVEGTLTHSASGNIYYDYRLHNRLYFPFALPYTVNTEKVRYRSGNNPAKHFAIQSYSGKHRAEGVADSTWMYYYDPGSEIPEISGTGHQDIIAGVGYNIFCEPENWSGTYEAQNIYGAHLMFPMGAVFPEADRYVTVTKHSSTRQYDRNWNLIGLPYLAGYTGFIYMANDAGKPLEDENGDPRVLHYVTEPLEGFQDYDHIDVSDGDAFLKPFQCYFIQFNEDVEDDIDRLLFYEPELGGGASAPRRRLAAKTPATNKLKVGITLAQNGKEDHTALYIAEQYTNNYDIDADLAKMIGSTSRVKLYSLLGSQKLAYMALPPANGTDLLETTIPLGYESAVAGQTMTFEIDTRRYPGLLGNENIYQVNLNDEVAGVSTNLLEQSYECTAILPADNNRFSLGVVYRAPGQGGATGCEEVRSTALPDGIYDLLGRPIRSNANALPAGVYIVVREGKAEKEVIR